MVPTEAALLYPAITMPNHPNTLAERKLSQRSDVVFGLGAIIQRQIERGDAIVVAGECDRDGHSALSMQILLAAIIAISYILNMKTVRYTADALKDLKRHGNMAERVRRALRDYAEGNGAHTNNVTQLVGSPAKRMRVGDFRAVFNETDTLIEVTKIGPRGGVYD